MTSVYFCRMFHVAYLVLCTKYALETQKGRGYKLIAQFSDAQVDLVDSVETGLDH
jgi:hypothetical protein